MVKFDWREVLGNWNPQLARELRGRLTLRNLILTGVLAIALQLCLSFVWQFGRGPSRHLLSPYCQAPAAVEYRQQLETRLAAIASRQAELDVRDMNAAYATPCPGGIDMAQWWHEQAPELFAILSAASIAVLLIGGTHLLIADLGREEQRGTLNFVRLSPRSATNIMLGKLLGVPCLLYLGVALALPWQWQLGQLADLSAGTILTLDLLGLAACVCCYSGALLFGLVSSKLRGFQAWLGSGAIAGWLWMILLMVMDKHNTISALTQLPFYILHPAVWGWHLIAWERSGAALLQLPGADDYPWEYYKNHPFSPLIQARWYNLHLDFQPALLVLLVVSIYAVLTLWFWQAIARRFQQPEAPLWTRWQSYLGLISVQAIGLGFALHMEPSAITNGMALGLHLLFGAPVLLVLSLLLSPNRATLIDWARYRHQQPRQARALWLDLLWGDRSPALIALWVHGAILLGFAIPWLPTTRLLIQGEPGRLFIICMALVACIWLVALSSLQLANLATQRRPWVIGATIFLAIGTLGSVYISLDAGALVYTQSWLLLPLPWLGLGLVMVGSNVAFVLWLRQLGQSSTRSLLAATRPRPLPLQPVGQPDRR
ncbi:MAG: hypothetical protein HC910_12335 [Spirulinaceae cyanobacterium SM2_1_0]|nr:hypothetical protein [Spirulinaceae cyanobacterium SM2_1_0]